MLLVRQADCQLPHSLPQLPHLSLAIARAKSSSREARAFAAAQNRALHVQERRDQERKWEVEIRKKTNYHAAGVPWYWIADVVIRQTEEYRWTPDGYHLVSRTPFDGDFRPELFPGLRISRIRS